MQFKLSLKTKQKKERRELKEHRKTNICMEARETPHNHEPQNQAEEEDLTLQIRHYRSLLRRCSPSLGFSLHAFLLKTNLLNLLPSLSSALFHFYSAVGSPSSLLLSFNSLTPHSRSTFAFTALISSFCNRLSLPRNALFYFRSMLRVSVRPDSVTLLALLSAASRLSDSVSGASAHVLLVKLGLPFSVQVCNSITHVYAKCGLMNEARRMFDEIPVKSDVSWTVLLDGVIKNEGLESAQKLFVEMPVKNEVSWIAIVSAYIQAGLSKEAFSLLDQMIFKYNLKNLNHISFSSLLSSCSQSGDLQTGQWAHTHILKTCTFSNNENLIIINTSLIDMYSKCGKIKYALNLFDKMPQRNIITYNAILCGLSMHGMAKEALNLYETMIQQNQKPDEISFVSLLSSCSRSGLLDQGKYIFNQISTVHNLSPTIEHFACMVDLLGRAGLLEEALDLIRKMPMKPNEVVLGSLIASCNLYKKLELGKELMNELVELYPNNTEYHVLLSNLYSSSGKYSEANYVRKLMRERNVTKSPGFSYIEINGETHKFMAGDKSHVLNREIYEFLKEVMWRITNAGYVPDLSCQNLRYYNNYLVNLEEREEREQALLVHSERLAVCLGLMKAKRGFKTPIRVFKNLRICNDCHVFMKFVSEIYEREIIVRDRNRFHLFKQGSCSCSDYW